MSTPRSRRKKTPAVIVDVDGTLAIITDRSPYATRGLSKDRPNAPVIAVAQALASAGYVLVVVSGRVEATRTQTEAWLDRHLGAPYVGPLFRADGDERKDAAVKREMYEWEIEPTYDVLCVLDDRDQTVAMWRSLGLACLQVAPGDF